MTEQEKNIVYLLQSVYEEFSALDEQHESDKKEFIEALHRLQHLIMIRSVRRNYSDLFPIRNSKIYENIGLLETEISKALQEKLKEGN